MSSYTVEGRLVDVHNERIFAARITVGGQHIQSIEEIPEKPGSPFIMPGFIDSHVHIESSMLVPSEFARLAVVHGTVATVSDPHEIANVCGMEGVEYMIGNGKTVPFKFNFGAPSCVPATSFETTGARLGVKEVEALLQREEIKYLSEMMNFPGVLQEDEEVMQKIAVAHHLLKPVDGHAPGLSGEDAKKYIAAGISTDHECFTREEALVKLQHGMKILIREGSAARNFDALVGLLADYPNQVMFCSDDKHPDSLVAGHINQLCARSVEKGIHLFHILKAACINPVQHYALDVGLLRVGDPADFILVKDLGTFEVVQTYINGQLVAENGQSYITAANPEIINQFSCGPRVPADFNVPYTGKMTIPVIEALDGQLITNKLDVDAKLLLGESGKVLVSNPAEDLLKMAVVNRHTDTDVALAFVKNFGLKQGALASSVAHDSHNIVAVGVDEESIALAVNMVIAHKGGISFVMENLEMVLPLPVAGLMSTEDGYYVAQQYSMIDRAARDAGCTLGSPFMTLSFMALLVIPRLKLSDKGLFDGENFRIMDPWH